MQTSRGYRNPHLMFLASMFATEKQKPMTRERAVKIIKRNPKFSYNKDRQVYSYQGQEYSEELLVDAIMEHGADALGKLE